MQILLGDTSVMVVTNVLLVYPPLTIPQYMQKRCMPPLGLAYIASALEDDGVDVDIIDCCVEGYETESVAFGLLTYGLDSSAFRNRISGSSPDVVGFSVPFSSSVKIVCSMASVVKGIYPNSVVVVGGLHPTLYPEDIFELAGDSVDWVIRGEGEHRFVEFVGLLKTGQLSKRFDGLVGRSGSVETYSGKRNRIIDLDQLGYPAYHLLPMEKYFNINVPFSPVPKGDRVLPILASRGCPIGCSFCASTNMWSSHIVRSASNVIDEVKQWVDVYGIDEIQFADDNLTLNKKHFRELVSDIGELGIFWCTPNGVMINSLCPDLISEMADSGMYQITLSVDSGSILTLRDLHHKPVDLDRVPSLIEAADKAGVFTHGTLVVGMPGESIESIKDSLNFVLSEFHFTSIAAFVASPIPGSMLYQEVLDKGYIRSKHDAWDTDTTRMGFNSDIDPDDLVDLIMGFQDAFAKKARQRNPEFYDRKYDKISSSGLMDKANNYGGRLT